MLWLVMDSAAGIIFFILGISYLARTSQTGDAMAEKNPKLVWGVLIGLTLLVVLVAIVLLALK